MYGTLYIFRGDRPYQKVDLQRGICSIGREKTTILLDDTEVSRLHAEINTLEDGSTITDRSTNGTLLNGKRLVKDEPQQLKRGDTITIGPFTVRFVPPQRSEVVKLNSEPGELIDDARAKTRMDSRLLGWESSYWPLLPPFYHDTDAEGVLNALLLVVETMLTPIDEQIRLIDSYFDPQVAPQAMLPWLALWVNHSFNQNLALAQSRTLIARAGELNAWRGTRRSLREYLTIHTTTEPIIIEPGQEQSLAAGHGLLVDDLKRILKIKHPSELQPQLRALIERSLTPGTFRVVVVLEQQDATVQRQQELRPLLTQVIEAEKPAHTKYELEFYSLNSA